MEYIKVQDRYSDSLSQLDLKEILGNSKHGELNFSGIQKSVEQIVNVLYELELNDYRIILPQGIVNEIDSFRSNIIQYIFLIKDFSISQVNASEIRSNYMNQLTSLYNSNYYRIEEILNNLKLKKLLSQGDTKTILSDKNTLSKEIEEVQQLKKELEDGLKNLKAANNAGEGQGKEIASQYFQESINNSKIGYWENNRRNFWKGMIIWFILVILIYIFMERETDLWIIGKITNEIKNKIELGAIGTIGFIFLYFGFSFATNNYYIEKSLNIENGHRKNIIDTYPLLTNADPNEINKGIIRLEAVKSIFSPIGQKIEGKGTEITTPFLEIIKGLVGKIQ